MSNGSYAYDPSGKRHDTVIRNGATYTSDGQRIGAGWTSQTAGGIYKMGDDGKGFKVNAHNQASQPKEITSNINTNNNVNKNNNNSSLNNIIRNNTNSGAYNSRPQEDLQYYYKDNRSTEDRTSRTYGDMGGSLRTTNRDDPYYRSDGYRWQDPNDFSHVVIELPNGMQSTVHRDYADQYANMGYNILAPSKGAARWHKEEAIRNDASGSEWVDDGTNNGKILMNKLLRDGTYSDGFSSVDAVYADKYFGRGYRLDPKSQSINRALQSGYHSSVNKANSDIRGGMSADEFNAQDKETGRWTFEGDGRDAWSGFGNAIDRRVGADDLYNTDSSGIQPDVGDSNINSTDVGGSINVEGYEFVKNDDGSRTIISENGEQNVSEDDYINMLLEFNGIEPLESSEKKTSNLDSDVEEAQGAEFDSKAVEEDAELKAIEAKAEEMKVKKEEANKSQINSFIESAKAMKGWNYSQSKRHNDGYVDCSSLVGRAMKAAGITDNQQVTTASMVGDNRFAKISKSEAQPGDIMWQKGHVAIYLGNNKVLEASGSKKKVVEQNLNNRFTHAYRIKV